MNKKPAVRIVILNYNGASLLPQCLPSIVQAAKQASYPTNITILDNKSTDDGLEYVKNNFPDVEISEAKENLYLCSYNNYLKSMSEDIALLLNNDIRVDEKFVDPLVKPFEEDQATFLVAPKVMDFEGKRVESGKVKAGIRYGLFWCDGRYPGYEKDTENRGKTYSSGFGAFSRKKFLELGGYDTLYLPGVMEDVDLCHRAQKRGDQLYYEPTSIVYHMGQASFKKKFGASRLLAMAHRNTFLFTWKNFSGFKFWVKHVFFLPFRLIYAALKGNFSLTKGFFYALRKQSEIKRCRHHA